MENLRTPLIIALFAISAVLYIKWIEFSSPLNPANTALSADTPNSASAGVPQISVDAESNQVPAAQSNQGALEVPGQEQFLASDQASLITVETDLVIMPRVVSSSV